MKTLFILVLFLATCCLGLSRADEVFRARLYDSATLEPLASKTLQFIPRRIMLMAKPGTPDPNLQFAETFTTDARGELVLSKAVINRLADNGGTKVDVRTDSHVEFVLTIHSSPSQQMIMLTTFRASTQVAMTLLLSSTEPNILVLDKMKSK